MRTFLILCAALVTAAQPCRAGLIDKALGAYASGNPSEARRLAQAVLAENPAEVRALLLMARTETGGRAAEVWFEQILAASGSQAPADEALLQWFEIQAATKSYGAIAERVEKSLRSLDPASTLADALRWWRALANLKLGGPTSGDRDLLSAVEHPTASMWNRRLRLLHADSRVDSASALTVYRKLLEEHDPYIESQSLLGLIRAYEKRGEIDRVLLYRSLLDEKYPDAASLIPEHTIAAPGPRQASSGEEAEKLAGVVYTVQLGVFADEDNARRLRDKHRRHSQPVHLFSRNVAGKTYWVVQVGSFTSLDEARKLLEELQTEDRATYRVVVR